MAAAGGYVQSLSLKAKTEDQPPSKGRGLHPTVAAATSAAIYSAEVDEIEVDARELDRQTGDFAVYKYYFSSIGWATSLMFFGWVMLYGTASKMTEFLLTYWTKAVGAHGNEVNGFYIGALMKEHSRPFFCSILTLNLRRTGMYTLLSGLGQVGLLGGIGELALRVVPRSAEILHARLLKTVMEAPLTFFTKTDTGQTTNR